VVPRKVIELQRGEWRVLLDEGTHSKVVGLRHARLPVETGGVILGYVDHKTHTIAVVDLLPAPADSVETQSGFIRGVEGLEEVLKRVSELSAKVVRYVGEWHSHPSFSSPTPSRDDRALLATLRAQLEQDGDPVLMLIVGAAGEIGVHVNGIES
jgi:integrative and conjugative element protein (TIGR02256 family)